MKSLAKNSIFNITYTALNLLFPLLSSMYVSRVLMADGIGKVVYAQNIASYFITFAVMGLPNYGLREIAKTGEDQEKKNQLFTDLIIINVVSTLISLSVYVILVLRVDNFRNEPELFAACGFLILINIFNIDWFYQGQEEYVYIVCRSLVIKVISLCALVLLVHDRSDYVVYAWLLSLGTGGNYLFNVIHARKYVSLDFRKIEIKKHLKPILIMAAGALISTIYARIDIFMLGIMSTDTNIGYYSYAHKTIEIIISMATALTAVFMPRLSYCYKNDRQQFRKLLDSGIRALLFLSPPMAVGIFLLATDIMTVLYGDSFVIAAVTVRIFAILIIVKSFGNLLCFQLVICTGNEKERLPATIWASLANVVLNFIFIPIWAERGAAAASVVSEVIVNGYQFVKMKKIVDIRFDKRAVRQSIINTLVMAAFVVPVSWIEMSALASFVISVIIGVVIYLVLNLVMKNEFEQKAVQKLLAHCWPGGIRHE